MKTALITGSSRGIGAEISTVFLEKNWKVIGCSRTPGKINHPNFEHIECDLKTLKREEIRNSLFREKLQNIEIDTLILNAGIGYFRPLENIREKEIQEMIGVNLLSPIFFTKYFLPQIKKKKGKIIFISSEVALQGGKMGTVYCATKAGISMFAESLFVECRRDEVGVTTIHPGMVRTSFFDDKNFAPEEGKLYAVSPKEVADAVWQAVSIREGTVVKNIEILPQKNAIRKKQP